LFCSFLLLACSVVILPPTLKVFHSNVGNLDEVSPSFGSCPRGEPYRGSLCSLAQEQVLSKHIAQLQPHIVTLVELVSAVQCAKNDTWCPSTRDASCCGSNRPKQSEQVLRILPPEQNWTVSCDTNDMHACIGVRSDDAVQITIVGCERGTICNSNTPAPPRRTCDFLRPPADLRSGRNTNNDSFFFKSVCLLGSA
jgi:hypothetical protein